MKEQYKQVGPQELQSESIREKEEQCKTRQTEAIKTQREVSHVYVFLLFLVRIYDAYILICD